MFFFLAKNKSQLIYCHRLFWLCYICSLKKMHNNEYRVAFDCLRCFVLFDKRFAVNMLESTPKWTLLTLNEWNGNKNKTTAIVNTNILIFFRVCVKYEFEFVFYSFICHVFDKFWLKATKFLRFPLGMANVYCYFLFQSGCQSISFSPYQNECTLRTECLRGSCLVNIGWAVSFVNWKKQVWILLEKHHQNIFNFFLSCAVDSLAFNDETLLFSLMKSIENISKTATHIFHFDMNMICVIYMHIERCERWKPNGIY